MSAMKKIGMGQKLIWRKLMWLWAIVPLVVATELFIQYRILWAMPSDADWKALVREITAEKTKEDLVFVTPDWAAQGRMFLKGLIEVSDFGRFDLTKYDRVFEVSIDGSSSTETVHMVLEGEQSFGAIELRRFRNRNRADVIYDFVKEAQASKWRGTKKYGPKIEIDYAHAPKYIIPLELKPSEITVTYEDVPLNGTIYGHGIICGIHRWEERNIKGSPIVLSAYVNGKKVGSQKISNKGPTKPFNFPIGQKGTGEVMFKIEAKNAFRRVFGFAADVRRGGNKKR